MKSNQRYSYFWIDLLIFGALSNLVLAKTPLNKASEEASQNDGDYSYGDDEIEPDQIKANPNSNKTMMPYFEEKSKTVYVKPGKKIELDCPVKNYDETKHAIMWLKDEIPLTNGQIPLSNTYKLDSKFKLTIIDYSNITAGNYQCNVMPGNIHKDFVLTTDDKPKIEPGQIKAHPNSNKTTMPYFEEKSKTVYVKPGEKIELDCPVKNYDETKHKIMWLKDEIPLTNGQIPLSNTYKLDSKFKLTIDDYSNITAGNYQCNVMPGNIHKDFVLTTDDKPKANNQNMLTTSTTTIAMLFTTVQIISFIRTLVY